MKVQNTLETPRLCLRQPSMDDAEAIFHGYAQDAEVVKYLTWRAHTNLSETQEFLKRCLDAQRNETALSYVITDKTNAALLGMITMRMVGFKPDIGYCLARRHWGNGYCSEAAKALVDWALAQTDIYRVWAICDLENGASTRVMEKAGMQREGILRRWTLHPNVSAEPRDCYCYSKVK